MRIITCHIGSISPRRQARERRSLQTPETIFLHNSSCLAHLNGFLTLISRSVFFHFVLLARCGGAQGSLGVRLRVTRSTASSAPSPASRSGGLRFSAVTRALRPRTALTVVSNHA